MVIHLYVNKQKWQEAEQSDHLIGTCLPSLHCPSCLKQKVCPSCVLPSLSIGPHQPPWISQNLLRKLQEDWSASRECSHSCWNSVHCSFYLSETWVNSNCPAAISTWPESEHLLKGLLQLMLEARTVTSKLSKLFWAVHCSNCCLPWCCSKSHHVSGSHFCTSFQ